MSLVRCQTVRCHFGWSLSKVDLLSWVTYLKAVLMFEQSLQGTLWSWCFSPLPAIPFNRLYFSTHLFGYLMNSIPLYCHRHKEPVFSKMGFGNWGCHGTFEDFIYLVFVFVFRFLVGRSRGGKLTQKNWNPRLAPWGSDFLPSLCSLPCSHFCCVQIKVRCEF